MLGVEDIARDYVHCTQCGACELRCPNTLFTGDFYRFRTRTVDLVKAMRALAVDAGIHQPGWQEWNRLTDERRHEPVGNGSRSTRSAWPTGPRASACRWAARPSSSATARPPSTAPRCPGRSPGSSRPAGVEFGLMREQWCCGGPAAEMGYVEQARRFAEHNVADWRAIGAKRIIAIDPHDYIAFTEDYPALLRRRLRLRDRLAVELVAEMMREGRLPLTVPIDRVVTYHDACRLNKRKGIHEAPREILRAIPGLTFKDVDHVTQWSYCSGAGGGLGIERPDLTAEISRRRMERAAGLDVDTLVSACVWSERPLTEAGEGARRSRSPSST